MAIRPTLGRNNRLVRRVMRHRRVTTLFPAAPAGTAVPAGTAWPADSVSEAARSGQGATAESGYIAVVIDPAASTVPTAVAAAIPEVRVSRSSAATPTRAPLAAPARIVRTSGPAPVGSVPQPQSPPAARMTSVAAAAPASPQPDSAHRILTPGGPTQEPSTPAVDDRGDTTLTDQVWRRLQTIFRRHQAPALAETEAADKTEAVTEPEAAAEAEPPPPEAEATGGTPSAYVATTAAGATATGTPSGPVQRMPDTAVAAQATRVQHNSAKTTARQVPRPRITEMEHTSESPVTDIDTGPPTEANAGVQVAPAETEAPPLATLDRRTEPSALPAAQHMDAAGPARPAGTAVSTATEAPALPAAAEPARIAPAGLAEPGGLTEPLTLFGAGPTLPSAPIERAAAPAQPAPPEQVEGSAQPAPAQPHPQPVTEIQSPAPDATVREIAASPAATPQIAPPLQDVWAVQRLPEPVRTVSSPAAIPAADRDRQLPLTAPEPIPDQIAEVLGRVPAGRPTQSTIEIIPPRRPRPVRAQQPATRLVAEAVALLEPALLAQETAQPTTPSARAVPAPEAIVVPSEDASGEGVPGAVPTMAPRMVETEIGALPADLWELIGETPPVPQDMPRSVPVEAHAPTTEPARMQASGPGPTLQRSAISTTAQAPTSATATQRGGPVETRTQQAPSSEAAASEPAASETGSVAASETDATGEPDVDVDKLAHRVYADIKRRLTVEWERIRRF